MRFRSFIIGVSGLVLGSFIGEVLGKYKFFSWLNYGEVIGIPEFQVDLAAVQISFGLTFNCTIACILGLLLALAIYYALR